MESSLRSVGLKPEEEEGGDDHAGQVRLSTFFAL